jgi:putative PIN family toxin of toxin-antitoxin system
VRIFTDTNVVISALMTRGLCAELYEKLLTEHELLIGEPVIAEVLEILARKFRADQQLLAQVDAELRLSRVVPAAITGLSLPIKDADDPAIIACALAGNAEIFVTGDGELLGLEEVQGMRILSPRQCWERLSQKA